MGVSLTQNHMRNIPTWIIKALKKEEVKCHSCHTFFDEKDIKSMGIRDGNDSKSKEFLFVELFCRKCKKVTLFELTEMYLEEFACEILGIDESLDTEELMDLLESEVEKNGDKDESSTLKRKKTSPQKSKITLKEVKDSVDFLNKINNHEEFLIALGMTPEEIDTYKHKKGKEK